MTTLGTQESQNYYNHAPQVQKKNLGDLYNKVYQINPSNIQADYINTLGSFYRLLCRKMIKSFFKINDFDEILNICLGTEKDSQSFLSFIKVIGNEVVMLLLTTQNDKDLIEVKRILRNIISQSKDNEQLKKFV